MKLSHYSASATLVPESKTQGDPTNKPRGLWVSVDGEDDWASWCRGEEFHLDDLAHRFRVDIEPGTLVLATAEDLLAFTASYGAPDSLGNTEFTMRIDWRAVARAYPGIIIAPYQWSQRLDNRTHWYYGWDCASGCIWDADIITSIEPAEAVSIR
jgi:hypothetical protein